MDHKNEHDFVSPPYPPIDPKPNPHYAQILMEDYAGIVSELTAITKYEYQSVVLMNTFPHFAKELSKIGMAEMHHLHILAQLIFKLGGRSTLSRSFQSNHGTFLERTKCRLSMRLSFTDL